MKKSIKVREYLQALGNSRKTLEQKVNDIASLTDEAFITEKLKAAEKLWTETFHRTDFPSMDHKDMELENCQYSHNFWKRVATLKGLELSANLLRVE